MSSSDVLWKPFCQSTSRARSITSSGSKLRGLAIVSIYALTVKSQRVVSTAATSRAGLNGGAVRWRRCLPPEQDPLIQPADRHQHQAEAHERQRAVDARQCRHVDQERLENGKRDHDRGGEA